MAFCSNCGAQVQGAFCPNCGTAMGSAAASGATGAGAYVPPATVTTAGGVEPHIASALCYLPLFPFGLIAAIIFLLVAPYNQNKFVRFSAFQSLFLHAACAVLAICLGILFPIMILIHLGFLLAFLIPVIWICVLVLFLFMMYKSFNNQKVVLPGIGPLADKQA